MKKINLGQNQVVHFIGIGGIGMSGLAQIMKNMGFKFKEVIKVKIKILQVVPKSFKDIYRSLKK